MKHIGLIGALLIAAGLVGCTRDEAPLHENTAVSEPPVVGSREITKADFEAYLQLKRIPADAGNRRERALKTFQERNGLAKAIANHPLLDQVAIDAEVRDFRNELLIRRYFEAFLNDKVSDEAMQAYYQTNIEQYSRRKVRVAHILFRIHRAMQEQQKSAKFSQAVDAHAKLAGGASFTKLAEQLSEDPLTAKKGGEIGWLQAGQIDNAIFEKAISMKKGEVSEPIKTGKGYHIIMLLEDPAVEQRPSKEVKGEIQYRLRYQAKQAEMKRLLSEISIQDLE